MTEAPDRRISIVTARRDVFKATAFTRAAALVALHERMERQQWLRLTGEFWTTTEGDKRALVALLRGYADWQPMMYQAECMRWAALPEWFKAWRGCYEGINEDGPAYTTDCETARAYPFVPRYRMAGAMPVLRCVWISRDDCVIKLNGDRTDILARVVNEWHRVNLAGRVYPTFPHGTSSLPALA